MEPSIFPVFYSFHRAYTKISTIFGSAHNFLYKIKHQAFLNQKEKGKHSVLMRLARLTSAQAGPRASRVTRGLPSSLAATDGQAPPVRSFSHLSPRLWRAQARRRRAPGLRGRASWHPQLSAHLLRCSDHALLPPNPPCPRPWRTATSAARAPVTASE